MLLFSTLIHYYLLCQNFNLLLPISFQKYFSKKQYDKDRRLWHFAYSDGYD